ncbi:translation elongation factor 4 [Patescibacteria group bacterium]|nr:translation elongation factor 4 [Patescibacteria group bacterium]
MEKKVINFSIIAHIDHGKSTLANQLLKLSVLKSKLGESFVDSMELEKERGITIKSKAFRIYYFYDGVEYELNMVDTPGHSDFSYEVSKALYACDYAFLLVDGVKGIQAQTFSNTYKAINSSVKIIPVVNKIDSISCDVVNVESQIREKLGFKSEVIHKISAKSGLGVKELLDSLIKLHINSEEELQKKEFDSLTDRALIFDSFYDEHQGVICLVRSCGKLGFNFGDNVFLYSNNSSFTIKEIGYFSPTKVVCNSLKNDEIGYVVTGLKDLTLVRVGDTLLKKNSTNPPFSDFDKINPLVYLGVYPRNSSLGEQLRKALDIIHLSDSSFSYLPVSTGELGFGFVCGFLGILHGDIILERVKREFNIDLVITNPSVSYKIFLSNGDLREVRTASEFSQLIDIKEIREPFASLLLVFPEEYMGAVVSLINERRGDVLGVTYSFFNQASIVNMTATIPLSELVVDLNDKLKSFTKGMGSFDYEIAGYRESDIVCLDIYINNQIFLPFSQLVHRSKAQSLARNLVFNLKKTLPREQFEIPLQAKIGGTIIARETLASFRKDVTAKLYGGDRTRKDKLLEKQKKGKKKMKEHGKVFISKDTFLNILKNHG